MPIDNIFFIRGRDLHLVRGQKSEPLDRNLLFGIVPEGGKNAAEYLAEKNDVTLEFKPLFKGVKNGDLAEGHGIHFNIKTGEIQVDGAAPATVKSNFIIEAVAKNLPDGPSFTETIRIHVHPSVVRMWLTPDRLVVRPSEPTRPEDTSYRFTVRAEFSDGVVGDVTENHGLTWSPSANVSSGLFGGRLTIASGNTAGQDVTIRANCQTAWGTHSATATMHIEKPWSAEPNPPKAEIIPGGGWPGTVRPETVPNILFLGDGFTAGDRLAFESVTNSFVHHLKSSHFTTPYNYLATSMNFWRAFVPAAATGISVLSEVFTFTVDGKVFARAMPPVRKPADAALWSIENLLYLAGLPLPADSGKTEQNLRDEWKLLVEPQVLHPDAQSEWNRIVNPANPDEQMAYDSLIGEWKAKANRTFIDEIDSFPGMSYGDPPAAEQSGYYSLDLRNFFDLEKAFFPVLDAADGTKLDGDKPLGTLWAKEDASFKFDNRSLVVYLSAMPGGRANSKIAMSMASADLAMAVVPVPGRNAFKLAPFVIPAEASPDACRTLAHELAHNFGVGDEYTEFPGRFAFQDEPLSGFANLQTEKSAKNAAGSFSGDEIKWNWHRITKAALIVPNKNDPAKPPITESAGKFEIPLRLGHGLQFQKGDQVLLRLRKWNEPLQKKPDTLGRDQMLEIIEIKKFEFGVTDPPPRDRIVVQAVNAGTVTLVQLERFREGSIVYLPTPAPESVRNREKYPFAEIVPLNIKQAITGQKRPLTPVPCLDTPGSFQQLPDLKDVEVNLRGAFFKPFIVGLYEGGATHTCGVMRPAGQCMMRNSHEDHVFLCPVCRYVIVDFVNPFVHFEIDREYDFVYPQS
ncbi:MAG: M64 family metallopeptidase [Candidatus Binatia bacterium]